MAASLGGAFSICLVREGCRPVGRKIIGPGNDPGFDGTQAWAAAIRKSPEVKVRQLDAVLKGEFKLARERRIFSWLANLETDIGVRTAGLKPTRMPRFFTMKDEGTAQARILNFGFPAPSIGNHCRQSHDIGAWQKPGVTRVRQLWTQAEQRRRKYCVPEVAGIRDGDPSGARPRAPAGHDATWQ